MKELWIVLCFSYIWVISILPSFIQSVNTGRSLWPLPVCVWCFVFPMYEVIWILLFWHYNHWLNLSTHAEAFDPYLCVNSALSILYSLTQSVNTGRSLWPLPVCVWCNVFSIFVCISLILHCNHWLSLCT